VPVNKGVDINIFHLELMHHFSTSTCFTLTNNAELKDIWRTSVPRIAFEQPYVLQAMLALTALHIARYRPERREYYEAYAARELESALRQVSALLGHITEETCPAVLSFSLLVTLNSLATPQKQSNLLLVGENGLGEWLYTFRGMGQIANGNWDSLLKSDLAPLLFAGEACCVCGPEVPPEKEALDDLKEMLSKEMEAGPSCQAAIEAVDGLLVSFASLHNRPRLSCEAPSVLVWPCLVSEVFIRLLNEKESWSLVVLAYYCVLLKKAEGFWWMEGWPVCVLGRIWELLEVRFRLKIRWPMESIGWVPPI
jgi:hypothetical protein